MEIMDALTVGSTAVGVTALVLGLPAFVWARRAERRARERHDVQWVVWWCRSGNLHIRNEGKSTARAVTVDVEPSHGDNQASGSPRDLAPEESITFTFPDMPPEGWGGSAHISTSWETDLGTVKSTCQTVER